MKRALLLCALLTACDSPTAQPDTALDMRGDWSYTARQAIPPLDMDGLLQITDQDGRMFSGSAAFTETDPQGTRRTRTGAVSGRVIGEDVVDMDLYVDLEVRRHVGRVRADSLNGSWSITGTPVNGAFTARRAP